jgi:ABC-type Fe3+/spermidine/putrescine transport system ATPase subunit
MRWHTAAAPAAEANRSTGEALRVDALRFGYGDTKVIDGVSFTVARGEIFCLVGPSGSGKSTLMSLLAGLLAPDGGSIMLGGRDVSRVPARLRNIGFVFQDHALFPHMTVARNVGYGLRLRGQKGAEANRRVDDLLELVGLVGLGKRFPRQLSGGQRQRVALARALAFHPEILLLDEPFASLDLDIREQLRAEIRRVQQATGVTTMIVTHDQEDAFALADSMGVMRGGVLEQAGTPAELYREPQSPFVARFMGQANIVRGEVEADGDERYLRMAGGRLPLPSRCVPGTEVRSVVRPEGLRIVPGTQGQTGLRASVRRATYVGYGVRFDVEIEEGQMLSVLSVGPDAPAQVGDHVTITCSVDQLHVMGGAM